MALTTQSAGLVRQKAYNAVYGTGTGTTSDSVSPYHFYAIKAFFLHMAANKGNPDLQFVPFDYVDCVGGAHGTSLVGGACTLYVWFGKAHRSTGTTASFVKLYDGSASGGDSDPLDSEINVQRIDATGEQFLLVHPDGFTVASDVIINATTTIEAFTQSTNTDTIDGFIIVG